MYSGIRRTLLAAAFGLVGGSAYAQAPKPMPPSAVPGTYVQQVQGAPAPLMAPASPFVALPATPGCGSPGCDPAWGNAEAAPRHRIAGRLLNPFLIGEGCKAPVGCGNLCSERTFIFGSCKQFFNAGEKCGRGCLGGFGNCAAYPLGTGGLGDHNSCAYGTALNR